MSVTKATPEPPRELPEAPVFNSIAHLGPKRCLKDNLERIGGEWLDRPASGDLLTLVHTRVGNVKVKVSMVPEVAGARPISSSMNLHSVADMDFDVVRCALAVAKTSSGCFTEAELGTNALGHLPQHLVGLLDPKNIVLNIHHAYGRPEFKPAHCATFPTSPSTTADIEGVLIHGLQGVRPLSVLLQPCS